jgi:hypothetical protein
MSEFSLIYPTTVQFQVTQVDEIPENYYDAKSWKQGHGVYFHEGNNCMYFVGPYSVNTMYSPMDQKMFSIIEDTCYDNPKVDESLFLKALAASNGHRL